MNLRLILPASAALFLVATSCTPYVEPPPPAPEDPAARKRTPEEEEKLRKEREAMKKDEENKTPDKDKKSEGEQEGTANKNPGEGEGTTPKPPEPKSDIQVARPVPGKPGFVFSPFNNKVIDVTGIPSGRLVADPTYPASEKKHFRVP